MSVTYSCCIQLCFTNKRNLHKDGWKPGMLTTRPNGRCKQVVISSGETANESMNVSNWDLFLLVVISGLLHTSLLNIMKCNLSPVGWKPTVSPRVSSHLCDSPSWEVCTGDAMSCVFHGGMDQHVLLQNNLLKNASALVGSGDLWYIHLRPTRCPSPDWWFRSSVPELVLEQLGVSVATAKPRRPSINKGKRCRHQW